MEHSEELVRKMREYWEKKYGEKLTESTANQYLDSMANLFSIFEEKE